MPDKPIDPTQPKLLCVSHSSRPFVEARSSLNGMESRFQPGRLDGLPPWESLAGIDSAVPFSGSLTIWRVEDGEKPRLNFLRAYDPGYKIQSAVFAGNRLLVCGADRLEVLDTEFRVVQTIRDNWICGGHTVFSDTAGHAWLTSAPANALLRVDVEQGKVVERIRLPDRYGTGYPVGPEHDLREHFIPTDLQPTHVNCAYPTQRGILVTLWIPGVVGRLTIDREFQEIVAGIRGCHGGKLSPSGRELYVSDSPTGLVWFFDPDTGAVRSRLRMDSVWLHDAHMISPALLVVSLSDKNELRMVERRSGDVVFAADCSRFGASVMFVTCCEPAAEWHDFMLASPGTGDDPPAVSAPGGELMPPVAESPFWTNPIPETCRLEATLRIRSLSSRFEYLALGRRKWLPPGRYRVSAEVTVQRGAVAVGLIDAQKQHWLAQMDYDSMSSSRNAEVFVPEATETQLVVSANNAAGPAPVIAEMVSMSIRQIAGEPVQSEPQPPAERSHLIRVDPESWSVPADMSGRVRLGTILRGEGVCTEYLAFGSGISVQAGTYLVEIQVFCRAGAVTVGLLDADRDEWYATFYFDTMQAHLRKVIDVETDLTLRFVLTAANPDEPGTVDAEIVEASLRPVERPSSDSAAGELRHPAPHHHQPLNSRTE